MKFLVALCGGASLLAIAPTAFAQDAAPSVPTDQTVVVTGSRIIRNGYSAPTPVTVATAVDLEALTPSTIPDALNKLPVFAGSISSAGGSNGASVSGNFLNLRDFGANRTLILMNGLRVPPTNFNGQVDVNAIPQMLLQRVDVVTGGASAVYGSDAVTGVVNFIMDTHFNGLKAEAQDGISGHGDAASNRYGLALGGDVLNLGHFEGSFEHYQEGGLTTSQRSFSAATEVYTGNGAITNPYTLTANARLPKTAFGGYVLTGPFAGQQFLANGQLGPYTPGAATASPTIVTGGNAAYYNSESLQVPQNQNQLYGRFDRDLTSNVSAFVQASDNWIRSSQRGSNWPQQTLTFFSGNPFLPASAQSALTAAGAPSFTAAIFPRDLQLQSQQTQLSTSISVTAGLTGKIVNNYNWELSYTHGESIFRQSLSNNINVPNFLAAIDAVPGPNGPVCYVSTTANASRYPGCVPLNVFGVGNESAAAKAYIFQTTQFQVVNALDDYVGSIAGTPFNDWAGPVSVALNGEFRQQSLAEGTNANPLAPVSFTGLRDVPVPPPTAIYAYSTVAPVNASNSVWEVSGETVIPVLKDLPLVKSFDISGAVRYTDYSSSGSVVTWKAGLDYQPIDDVRIRATESRDIRAPTLYDLYAGQSASFFNVNDPHTNTSKVTAVISQGNPNLAPEVSTTTTAGVVYSPHWVPHLRMSVDYYDITMNNAITSLGGNNPTILQQCEAVQWNSTLCSTLITRPLPFSNTTAANFPTAVYTESFNIAKTWTQGVDVEASYNTPLSEIYSPLRGNVNFRLLYSYQPTLDAINFPGSTTTNAAGAVGLASSRATFMAGYDWGPVQVNWQTRYSSPEKRSGTIGQYFANPPLPSYTISDMTLSYRFKVDSHTFNTFFNMTNVFDVQPRIAPSIVFSGIPGFGSTAVGGDDILGRYFTAGVRFNY